MQPFGTGSKYRQKETHRLQGKGNAQSFLSKRQYFFRYLRYITVVNYIHFHLGRASYINAAKAREKLYLALKWD
jgi:hypothetical protein